jgi:hypothetical protein
VKLPPFDPTAIQVLATQETPMRFARAPEPFVGLLGEGDEVQLVPVHRVAGMGGEVKPVSMSPRTRHPSAEEQLDGPQSTLLIAAKLASGVFRDQAVPFHTATLLADPPSMQSLIDRHTNPPQRVRYPSGPFDAGIGPTRDQRRPFQRSKVVIPGSG